MTAKAARLEHVNFTVPDAEKTAQNLCDLFDWKIRWQGPSLDYGFSIHVGGEHDYLALFTPTDEQHAVNLDKRRIGHLNHVGLVVDDIDAAEQRVIKAGYKPYSHGNYEPGRRFYFDDENGIEFEVVSYD